MKSLACFETESCSQHSEDTKSLARIETASRDFACFFFALHKCVGPDRGVFAQWVTVSPCVACLITLRLRIRPTLWHRVSLCSLPQKKRMLRSYCVTILSRSYHDTIAILFRSISLRPDYDPIAIVGRSYYDLITS